LHLSAHLDQVLGIELPAQEEKADPRGWSLERLLVVRRESERWVFRVDEVDGVHRISAGELARVPATVGRAAAHLTKGVFSDSGRTIGLIDDEKLFAALRARSR
jgi:chemotaxis-related protein WspD